MARANEWIERYSTRSVYEATDLFSEPDIKECVAWFLPKWAYYVSRSFLLDYGQRNTSFSLGYRTGLYLTPTVAEWDEMQGVISEALGGGIICISDVVQAIQDLTVAVEVAGGGGDACNSGSGGAGRTPVGETQNQDNGVDDPTGGQYDSYTDYQTNKCGWAEKILLDIVSDLEIVKSATISTWAGSLVAVALLTPIPFDDIIALVALVITLVSVSLIGGFAQVIIDAITGDLEAAKCALYNGANVSEARTALRAHLDLPFTEDLFLSYWLSTNSLNRLFVLQSALVPDTSCPCAPDAIECQELIQGFDLGGNVYAAEDVTAWYSLYLRLNKTSTAEIDRCAPRLTFLVTVTSGVFTAITGRLDSADFWEDVPYVSVYKSQVFPTEEITADTIHLISETPVTYTVEVL